MKKFLLVIFCLLAFTGNAFADGSDSKVDKYFDKAMAKWDKHNYRGAVRYLDKVIKLDPEECLAYLHRGQIKMTLKDYKGAIKDFEELSRITKERGDEEFYEDAQKYIEECKGYLKK